MLDRELTDAGFGELRVERLAYDLSFASDDEVCEAVFEGGPVALAYGRFDASTRRAAHEDFLSSIAAFRNGSGYGIPAEYVLASGVRT